MPQSRASICNPLGSLILSCRVTGEAKGDKFSSPIVNIYGLNPNQDLAMVVTVKVFVKELGEVMRLAFSRLGLGYVQNERPRGKKKESGTKQDKNSAY